MMLILTTVGSKKGRMRNGERKRKKTAVWVEHKKLL
jgi:hypothetical protein